MGLVGGPERGGAILRIGQTRWARWVYRIYGWALAHLLCPLLWIEQRFRPPKGPPNDRLIEYPFALQALGEAAAQRVLDVGSGDSSWPHLLWYTGLQVKAIDKQVGYERFPLRNRHFRVQKEDITASGTLYGLKEQSVDAITCISTLEHIRAFDAAMKGMFVRLRRGGVLILTIPWWYVYVKDLVAHLGEDSLFSVAARREGHLTQLFSPAQVDEWCRWDWRIIRREDWHLFTGMLYMQGGRLARPRLLGQRAGGSSGLAEGLPGTQLSCFVFQRNE